MAHPTLDRLSVSGRRWQVPDVPDDDVRSLAHVTGLPDVVCRLMAIRGVDAGSALAFLTPRLRDAMPDPSVVTDLDRAADRLADAIVSKQTIAVIGDYDVDGACCGALLTRYFEHFGQAVDIHVPDRVVDGYGPNVPTVEQCIASGIDVLLTVDCGTAAHEPLAVAEQAGLDVIVLDHHQADDALPSAFAVVNPNRADDDSDLGYLSAAGVVFLVLVATNRALRQRGGFAGSLNEPDLRPLLDLVALSTVCDVVPLVDLNRAFVNQGLKIIARRENTGLRVLADLCGLGEHLDAYHLGYVLGPRVNAGGRVGRSGDGTRLLSTNDGTAALAIARQLDADNTERRALEDQVLKEALGDLEQRPLDDCPLLVVVGERWHPGVIGIVAARLKERFQRPAIVIAVDETGTGKASGRSVKGVDLGAAVIAARLNGLLEAGGGHRMAAGFTVARERLRAAIGALTRHVEAQLNGSALESVLSVDAVVAPSGVSIDLIRSLERLAPFGAGNSEPRIAVRHVRVGHADVVGGHHIRCRINAMEGGASFKGIAFRALDTAVGKALLSAGDAPLALAGHLRADTWNGRTTVQLVIEDVVQEWSRDGW